MRTAILRMSLAALAVLALTTSPGLFAETSDGALARARGTAAPARPASTHPVRNFRVTASKGRIVPAHLRARVGDRVRITFVSLDGTYNVSFKDFGVKAKITTEKSIVVKLKVKKKGTFKFRCTRPWGVKRWSKNGVLVVD